MYNLTMLNTKQSRKNKALKYTEIKKSLEGFQHHREIFSHLRDGFKELIRKHVVTEDLKNRIIQQNPISLPALTEFMAVHLYEFIGVLLKEEKPSKELLVVLDREIVGSNLIKGGAKMTYRQIYRQYNGTQHRGKLLHLLNEMEQKSVQKTISLLEDIICWGSEILTRYQMLNRPYDVFYNALAASVKGARIFSMLIHQVTLEEPGSFGEETHQDIFPLLYSLTDLWVKGPTSPWDHENKLAADSSSGNVNQKHL